MTRSRRISAQLLVEEFDAPLADIRFEQRVEVKSRIDALIGRTVFEAKRDLASEMKDVERKMPDYLANREAETGEPFVGIASDGRKWVVLALEQRRAGQDQGNHPRSRKAGEFLAWLDGALALKISLPPDPRDGAHRTRRRIRSPSAPPTRRYARCGNG